MNMSSGLKSAVSSKSKTNEALDELAQAFAGLSPRAIVFFAGQGHDGSVLARGLRTRFPAAEVIGCTTAGEFTQERTLVGGVTALALGAGKLRRCAGALADFSGGVEEGIRAATARMAQALEVELRSLDPQRYVGVVLIEGLQMYEEAANATLGNVAPLLSFVGGSAGDNLEFRTTQIFHNESASSKGAALLLVEAAVPFTVSKTCSFQTQGPARRVTRADASQRVVYELDGKPVTEVYAAALGVPASGLDATVFMKHPLGQMIDGAPWIRSPLRVLPDGGLKFYCQIQEGMELHVMKPTDLVGETKAAFGRAATQLGAPVAGGLAFNCILRRLEMDARNLHGPFLETFSGTQTAGFHTYGESYLGHMNQTLTALWFA
jgi:hypothetical protein